MSKIILCGLLLCALAPSALGRQDERAASVYYREGTRYALRGRLEEAAAAFEQAVRLDPKNGNAHFSLGNVYAEQGRWADAVAAYRKAVALRKKDGEAYNNLGIALARRGEYERAAGAFERAIAIFPDWAEPRYHLSLVHRRLGRDVAGQVAYQEALARRPDYAARPPRSFTSDAGAPRAEAAAARTSAPDAPTRPSAPAPKPVPSPAAEARREAVAREEVSPYELGMRHSRAGRHEEAVASFTEAVGLDRNHAAAYAALGGAYASLGRWRESVEAYERAVRLNPRDAEAFEMLGRSYAKLRETTPADEAAEGSKAATNANASTAEAPAAENAPAAPPVDADPTAVYRVGPGDVLEVRVTGAGASQAAVHKVSPTGLLDHPRLDRPVKVEGLTTDEVAAQLGAGLKAGGVTVGVSEYASHAIIVSGLVKDPGTKILRREAIPLYVIVAHAQPLAAAGQALVTSKATGRTAAVNLADEAAMKRLVFPGDVINVQPLPKQFYYVAGAVRQPGQKEFHLGLTLTQALLAAGGTQPSGARSANITRQGEDGRLVTTRYDLREIEAGRAPDPALQPGDRLEVQR